MDFDIFISYASEDRDSVARPLATELARAGLRVWFDESEIRLGDSLRRSIDGGLSRTRFGVVILSKHFFAKEWPKRELDGLLSREEVGAKVILPIWHGVTKADICQFSPILADRVGVPTDRGLEAVVVEILRLFSPVDSAGTVSAHDEAEDEVTLLPEEFRTRLAHLANILREVTVTEAAGRAEEKISVLRAADKEIHHLCKGLYPSTTVTSDGMTSQTSDRPGPVPLMFVPVSSATEELEQIASWSALYSDFTLFVTEHELFEFERVTQRDILSSGLPRGAEKILALNKSLEEGLRRGACLILPRTSTAQEVTTRESSKSTYYAPFHQQSGDKTWFPLNGGRIPNAAIRDYLVYKTVIIPHITGASLATVIHIARNESDSFHRFNRCLRRAIRRLPKCRSERGIQEVLDEIDSNIADLRLEGERLLRLKALSDARLTFVNLSMSVFASSDAELVRAVAGINAGSGFAELLKDYARQTKLELTMRKSDFFFPFLVRTRSGERMFRTSDGEAGA